MLLTVKDVAHELKVNVNYVYRLINAELLPSLKIGSRKVRPQALEEFLEKYEGKDIDEILEERKIEQ